MDKPTTTTKQSGTNPAQDESDPGCGCGSMNKPQTTTTTTNSASNINKQQQNAQGAGNRPGTDDKFANAKPDQANIDKSKTDKVPQHAVAGSHKA